MSPEPTFMQVFREQGRVELYGSDPCVTFKLSRPSGKTHEIMYPKQMLLDDFEGVMLQLRDFFEHWMQWCDQQQVCPLKK